MSRRPYRILQLTGTSAIGGAEQVALDLARGCDRDRFEVVVASLGGPPLLIEACLSGQPPVQARHWRAGSPWPWRLDRLLTETARLRATGVDLAMTYGLRADLVGRLFKGRLGAARLLCAIHSTDAWRGKGKILLDRWTSGAADAFVSVSAAGRRVRIEREGLPAEKIALIPNGIRVDAPELATRKEARAALGVADEDFPVIAHVANLRPMKGHGEVLAAAPDVLRRHPRALFLLAGRDESGGDYARRAQAAGLAERVRFLGYHPRAREVMRAADVFILPSHYEGCPISILEAMAERRPIVASNVGGIGEQVRDGVEALLIAPRRADALAEAIARLADDADLCRRLTEAARRRVEQEFSRERMIARYETLWEAVIERRPLPGVPA
jgi:glycosyltransferase involved in cell wall biosynthesis